MGLAGQLWLDLAGAVGVGHFEIAVKDNHIVPAVSRRPQIHLKLAGIQHVEGEAIVRCAQSSTYKSTGMYFGVYNLIVKALNGLALFLTGLLASQGSILAVRAMPFMAGGLCAVGVLVYIMLKKEDPVVVTAHELDLSRERPA